MKITLNGELKDVAAEKTTIRELLIMNDVKQLEMVTVQLNGVFLPKEQFTETLLYEKDEVDFMFFMGGGQ